MALAPPGESDAQLNEQFRAILEAAPDCVMVISPDGGLIFMNAAGLAMFGIPSVGSAEGQGVYEMIAPAHRARFREFNAKVCAGEQGSLEFEILSAEGVHRRLESRAAPFRYADGATVQLAFAREITEPLKTEQAGLLLAAIVDSSDDAIVSKDLNGVVTTWNKSAERLFGYSAREAIGRTVAELLIPDDRQDEELTILARLRRGERVDHFETVRRRKDGSLLDISLTISPVKDTRGRIIGASKIARDISDRKRAERAIRSFNEQLAADLAALTRMQQLSVRPLQVDEFPLLLGEIISAVIEITGADMGNIQLLEEGQLRIAAHRGFDAPFLNYFERIREGAATACGAAFETRQRVIVEDVANSTMFSDGPTLGILLDAGVRSVQSTPLITRGGDLIGMLSTHYRAPTQPTERDLRLLDILARQTADLIERQRAEAALLASARRFRQLADMMPQIVWTARPDGHVDYCNERWYEFTGFSRDESGDMTGGERILDPQDLERTRETYRAAITSGQPYNIEYRFWDRREQRSRWFVGRALPVRNSHGKIVKWFGTCTDIDEQKRVQEELQRANQDLEQFAFSASHDLQEPLRSLKIYSELLEREFGEPLPTQAKKYLRYLRTGATRMETLVRDLLAYTRATQVEMPPTVVDANEACAAAVAALAEAAAEAGAAITAAPLPSVRAHATRLQQVFQNLIGNAVKYRCPERTPAVHVSCDRGNGEWVFAVRDNGIGIESEYKENIFGIFKRLHTADQYSGTGIGLAICQRIVEGYRGRIWVESEPGQGSVFYFTLPV